MEDHHVDRLDVEALQGVELTSTNSSIGLIVLINQCPSGLLEKAPVGVGTGSLKKSCVSLRIVFRRPGGYGEVSRPDPIPNSEVKRLSADGTVSQDPGE